MFSVGWDEVSLVALLETHFRKVFNDLEAINVCGTSNIITRLI